MSWKFDISDTYCSSRISLDNYFSCNPYTFDNNCLAIVRSSRASPYNHLTKEGGTIIFLFISVSRFYQIQIRKLQTGRHKGRVKVELKGSEYKNQFCAFSNLKWEESFILLAKQTFFLIFVYVAQVCFSPTSVKKNNKSTLNLPVLLRRYVWEKERKSTVTRSMHWVLPHPRRVIYTPGVALTWRSELHGNLPSQNDKRQGWKILLNIF